MLIEVLVFFSWLNSNELPFMVDKVNGSYHNFNIESCGMMVLRYNGNGIKTQLDTEMQEPKQEDTTIR
jgi:hypothetical protein